MLTEGLLVLGRVKEVQDFKVMVSLPHSLLAALPITNISDVYTHRLQSVVDANADDVEVSAHYRLHQSLSGLHSACWGKFYFFITLNYLRVTSNIRVIDVVMTVVVWCV